MKKEVKAFPSIKQFFKTYFWVGLSFLLVLAIFIGYGNETYNHAIAEQDNEMSADLSKIQIRFQEIFLEARNATKNISLDVKANGEYENFEIRAKEQLDDYQAIDILQLLEGTVIKHTYPQIGNESVVGLDIFNLEAQKEGILYSINEKDFHYTGPFELRQGGMAFAIRRPIYRNDRFWGFAAAIIRMETILKVVNLDSTEQNMFGYQLANIDLQSGDKKVFFPFRSKPHNKKSRIIQIPGGKWELSVFHKEHIKYLKILLPFILIGLIVSFLTAFFVYNSLTRRRNNEQIIRQQKEELDKIFERILEGYIQLDNLWEIVSINSKTEELLQRTQDDLIGKNFFTEFPDFMEYQQIREIIESKKNGEPIHLKSVYSKTWNSWFDSLVYPSAEGVSIYFSDVSQQKNAELKLEKNEKKYRTLIEQASVGIVVYSFDKSIHEFNDAVCEIFGYTKEEISNLKLDDVLVGDYIQNKEVYQKMLDGNAVTFIRDFRHKTGHIVNAELNVKMLDDGKLLAIVKDITEKLRNESLIRESELKYRSLFEQAADCIVIYEPGGKILDVNQAVIQLMDLPKSTLLKSHITDFLDDDDLVKKPLDLEEIMNGKMVTDRRKIKSKTGADIILEMNSKRLPDGNIMVIGKDITEILNQKEALEDTAKRFDLATHAADLGVWEFNLVNKKRTWNDRMFEMYEIDKKELKVEFNFMKEIVHPEDWEKMDGTLKNAIREGNEFNHVFRIINKKGTIKYIESLGRVINHVGKAVKILGVNRDISEKYEAQEKIRKSNELYELVSLATNDAIWDWEIKTNTISRIKNGLQKVYGIDENSLIGTPELFQDRVHPEDKNSFSELKERIFTDKSLHRFEIEYRFLKPNGSYVYLLDIGYVIRDDAGYPKRIIGSAMDFTDKKMAEEALVKSEDKYRSLIQQASDAIIIYDLNGKILDCNETALKISGFSRSEFLKKAVQEVLSLGEANRNPLKFDDLKKGKQVVTERTIIDKIGNLIPMEINSKMMPDGNIIAIARDITERKKAEEDMQKLISLVETSNDIIGISNLEGVPIYINKATRDLMELDENEDLSKFHFTDFMNPENLEIVVSGFMSAFTENKKWNGEVLLRSFKTHKIVPVLASVFVIRDKETGKAIAIGNVSHNISERKKAESEMKELNEQLRTLTIHLDNVREEERKDMAREIHDELGQQLTGLRMQVGMLAKKINPEFEEVQEQLVDIQELVAQMVGSVKRIIFNLRPHILDDFGIVATMDSFANEFEKRYNIKTTFISSHDDLKLDAGISIELFRIFQESLTNIAKHADAKNVVTTFNYNDKNCVMAITDDGVGFDLEDSNNSYGLMGMKERAIKLDADFNIESKPGSGTVITVTVPV